MLKERFWVRTVGRKCWQEVTKEQFIEAERNAGLHPKPGCGDVATHSFLSEMVEGMTTYDDQAPTP